MLAPIRAPAALASHPTCVRPRYVASAGHWVVDDGFRYHDLRRGIDLEIVPGFICDLASVPRALWWVLAPFELSQCAPVLHDWLYKRGGLVGGRQAYTREQADQLFQEVMEEEGVPAWRRAAAFRAVRLFGRFAWRPA